MGLILELEKFPGAGNGIPLQYPCLENSIDRRAWQATIHGGNKESDTTEQQEEDRKSVPGVEVFNFQLLSLVTNRSIFVTDQPLC